MFVPLSLPPVADLRAGIAKPFKRGATLNTRKPLQVGLVASCITTILRSILLALCPFRVDRPFRLLSCALPLPHSGSVGEASKATFPFFK